MFELMPFDRREHRELNRFFNSFDREFFSPSFGVRTDIKDDGDNYLVEAELPGFKKEEIEIDVNGDVLTVSASHSSESEEKNDNYVRRERRSGSYRRSFDVSGIDVEGIKAGYNNGVLELTLPKLKEIPAQTKKIEVD